MKISIYRQWEVIDSKGHIIKRYRQKKCNSYVTAFPELLYVQFASTTLNAMIDTANASVNVTAHANTLRCDGGAGVTTHGLVVGTGTAAVALADYKLGTLIATGTGSGQLVYGATTFQVPATSGTTRRFRILRTFTNNSGASITVNEVGIYAQGLVSGGGTTYYLCIERSLESPGVAIADGLGATLTYTIGVTV